MVGLRASLACATLVCVFGLFDGRKAIAQSAAAQSAAAQSAAAQSAAARAAATNLQMVPIPMPMFAPSQSSGTTDSLTGLPPATSQTNMFNNPYAAPFLYSSMVPGYQGQTQAGSSSLQGQAQTGLSTSPMGMMAGQMGLMMMATQRPLGTGAGPLNGAQTSPSGDSRQARAKTTGGPMSGRSRLSVARPGGLAAHYFNRTTPHSPYPQSYFNRQNRYYP
jgi:hypothetical protein